MKICLFLGSSKPRKIWKIKSDLDKAYLQLITIQKK